MALVSSIYIRVDVSIHKAIVLGMHVVWNLFYFTFILFSKTDSNLPNENAANNEKNLQKYDLEFNIWTRQDCEDSPIGLNANR